MCFAALFSRHLRPQTDMGITMDITCYGFDGDPCLESVAAQDLVSLTAYSAVLKDCQLGIEQEDSQHNPRYRAWVQLTLWDDEPVEGAPVYGESPEEAISQAFDEAQQLLQRLALRRPKPTKSRDD